MPVIEAPPQRSNLDLIKIHRRRTTYTSPSPDLSSERTSQCHRKPRRNSGNRERLSRLDEEWQIGKLGSTYAFFERRAKATIASNRSGRGCFSAGTAINCGRRPSLANVGWPAAVMLE